VRPARAALAAREPVAPSPDKNDRDRVTIEATIGLAVTIEGGDAGEISEIEPAFATVSLASGGWTQVRWGATVRTDRGRATIEPPGYDAIVAGLTTWRAERAAHDKVPAYVVMHNSTRDGIARAQPSSVVALSRCPGIGPTKIERYGDDILVVVEQSRGPELRSD
jgi:superfamily II DNA helicase RecQ